jgi:AcrR family transcriptional regulator
MQRPRLKDRLRRALLESILTAAEQTLSDGLRAVRMNDIAERAGVAVGTLYNHFADRDALLGALIAWRCNEILARVDQILDTEGLPFPERLRLIFEAALSFVVEHRPFCAPLLPGLYARLQRLVSRGVKEGALRAAGADLFPALLIGTLRGAFLRLGLLDESTPINPADVSRFCLEGAGA